MLLQTFRRGVTYKLRSLAPWMAEMGAIRTLYGSVQDRSWPGNDLAFMKTHNPLKGISLIVAFAGVLASTQTASAQAGQLDPTFGTNGLVTQDFGNVDGLECMAIQPGDQKIVTAGTASNANYGGRFLVMRNMPDGSLDTTFNGTGYVILPDYTESYAYACFIGHDGKIVVAGAETGPDYQFALMVICLNPDGSLDSTFGTNGIAIHDIGPGDDFAYGAVETPDHKIMLSGSTTDTTTYNNVPIVVRLMEDGSIDTTYGTNGIASIPVTQIDNVFQGLVLQADGKVVVCGHKDQGVTIAGGEDFDVLMARFHTDGTLDTSFGTDGIVDHALSGNVDQARAIAMTTEGKFLLTGFIDEDDGSVDAFVLRYDSTGTIDFSFGSYGLEVFNNSSFDAAFGMTLQADGKILITGTSGAFFGSSQQFLARYLPDGGLDLTFNNIGFALAGLGTDLEEAHACVQQTDGKILIAGKGRNPNNNDATIIRFLNDFTTGIPEASTLSNSALYPNPAAAGSEVALRTSGGQSGIVSVLMMDACGRTVDLGLGMQGRLMNDELRFTIPSNVLSGSYMVRLTAQDGTVSSARLAIMR